LGQHASTFIFPADQNIVNDKILKLFKGRNLISWSLSGKGTINAETSVVDGFTVIQIHDRKSPVQFKIPFPGAVPVNNSLACYATLKALQQDTPERLTAFEDLQPIDMRLKAEVAIQGCVLIND